MSAEEIVSDNESKPAIELSDVWVQYQLRNAHHHNLKRTLTNGLLRRKDEVEIMFPLRHAHIVALAVAERLRHAVGQHQLERHRI